MHVSNYTGAQIDEAVGKVIEGKVGGMTSITYEKLVELRKNSQLTPGMQYRITDYETMTSQIDTKSAGHKFDIIVTADSKNVLNENAKAIHHDGCDDFKDNNLAAWELKYSLTNDDNIYLWAKEGIRVESRYRQTGNVGTITSKNNSDNSIIVDGKIYFINKNKTYTIESQAYYKTKNASYFVPVDYNFGDTMISYTFAEKIPSSFITNEKTTVDDTDFLKLDCGDLYVKSDYNSDKSIYSFELSYAYTIAEIKKNEDGETEITCINPNDGDVITDIVDETKITINNSSYYKLKKYSYYIPVDYHDGSEIQYINKKNTDYVITSFINFSGSKGVIYYMKDEFNNECPYDFKNIKFLNIFNEEFYTFGSDCHGNTILRNCTDKNIYSLNSITLGNSCYNNIFGYNCRSNSFGNNCYNNIFGNNCEKNSFGNNCEKNSFGNSCNSNIFSNNCSSNTFGESCQYITFGDLCSSNSFGNDCYGNSFGIYCYYNSFGNDCDSNSFGNYCSSNSFGNECDYNHFGYECDSNSLGNSCSYNNFGKSKDKLGSYYRYIIFDNGNSNINLNCTSTTSNTKYFQNVRIGLGVNNNTITEKTISDSNVGQNYQTLYKRSSSTEKNID